jgi:hypothetical protein
VNTPVFVIYVVLVVLGAVPALTFPIYYSVKVRWWRLASGEDRETAGHVVMFSACFALLYVRGGINLSTPAGRYGVVNQSPGAAGFLVFLALFAAVVVWHRVWLFHKGRKKRSKEVRP